MRHTAVNILWEQHLATAFRGSP